MSGRRRRGGAVTRISCRSSSSSSVTPVTSAVDDRSSILFSISFLILVSFSLLFFALLFFSFLVLSRVVLVLAFASACMSFSFDVHLARSRHYATGPRCEHNLVAADMATQPSNEKKRGHQPGGRRYIIQSVLTLRQFWIDWTIINHRCFMQLPLYDRLTLKSSLGD